MSYVALYRKYRPNNFNDLIGQNAVTSIIKNEILNNKVSHAYIFSGPRGTGKTSAAKIIAKMVNCHNLSPDGVPCGTCSSCLNFYNSSDVVEIDAASNNGVDEIRELRDKVNLVPTYGKYKVYIIDEVHMLTNQAFNALLKTLEEPPKHIIFILATTEFSKIPDTVVSRCQKFQFSRFSTNEIVERLVYIASKENISIDREILVEIARLSNGGLRDAINIFDQFISYSGVDSKKSLNDLYLLNGVVSLDEMLCLLDFIIEKKLDKIVSFVNDITKTGKDMSHFLEDFSFLIKNVYLLKNDIDLFDEVFKGKTKALMKFSNNFSSDFLYNTIFSLNELVNQLRNSNFSSILLTMFFINLSLNYSSSSVDVDFSDKEIVNNDVGSNDKNISFTNNSIIENIENKTDSKFNIQSLSLELKKIRINNAFATASKEYKENFLKNWKIAVSSDNIDPLIKSIISDLDVLVVGENDVIFAVKYDSLLERVYNHFDQIKKIIDSSFEKEYRIVFIDLDEWKYEKDKYILNIKSGKNYVYIDENDRNKKCGNDIKKDDVDKIISILGDDVVNFEN